MTGQNFKAFLDMIAVSEGTAGHGEDGYNVIVGGSLFPKIGGETDYRDHPRKKIYLPRLKIYSTAAGRYQLLTRYWDAYRQQLDLRDFSPASQDAVALQQIRERRAVADIELGCIPEAIEKCRNIWASFPGAGYGQREHKLDRLLGAYEQAGGQLA